MSKVDELRIKYKNIRESTFSKFNEIDTTPTKKYLDYMCNRWAYKDNPLSLNVKEFAMYIMSFDSMLPYIENKDIYSRDYRKVSYLYNTIEKAIALKEEKSFDKKKHIIVVAETDNYLMVYPKTHRGSVKYGSKTKWCTTTKSSDAHFIRYQNGSLIYLIDKKGDKNKNYEKIAMLTETQNSKFINNHIELYNSNDTVINEINLTTNGWSQDEIFEISLIYRTFVHKYKNVKIAESFINDTLKMIKAINIDKFKEKVTYLKSVGEEDYFNESKVVIDKFKDEISVFYGNL